MAGKINAEAVKITESMWLTQNSGGNKLVAYYPVTDVTEVLATEDGVSGDISSAVSTHNSDDTAHTDIQTKIGTDISTHNSDDTAHTAIQDKIGTDIGTHNSDSSAHTDIQTKIGTDIGTHNSDSSAHTAIQTKIGTDIGTHNSDDTSHEDIRTEITTHTGDSSIHLANASAMALSVSGNLSCAQGFAGLQTDGDFGYVYLSTRYDKYRFKASSTGIDIYIQSGTNWVLSATVPTSSGVNDVISTHNLASTVHGVDRQKLINVLNDMAVGTVGAGDGKVTEVRTHNNLNRYGTTAMIGDQLLQEKRSESAVDTYYLQQCGSNGLPEIFRKTPADSVPINMGDVLTTGQRCTLVQNGYCAFSGLSATAFYFNPLNSTATTTQVWSGNTSFYALDTATVAVDATSTTAATAVGDKRIKILVAGKYKISGWAKYQSAAGANFYMRILKNSAIRGWWDAVRYYGAYPCINEVLVFDCAVNDLIILEIYSGGQTPLDGFQGSLSIEKVG